MWYLSVQVYSALEPMQLAMLKLEQSGSLLGCAFDSVDAAIVYGVNHNDVKATDQIISSVSCTTQALVPLVKIIDDVLWD